MSTREEHISGGLYGLLVGDALGVPYEFHAPAELPAPEAIDFEPPEGFRRAHEGVPPGTWSDDGAHALCRWTRCSTVADWTRRTSGAGW